MSFENHEAIDALVPRGETPTLARKQAAGVSVPPQSVAKQADSPHTTADIARATDCNRPFASRAQSTLDSVAPTL